MGLAIVISVVVLGLIFEFVNGFHDAANAIATVAKGIVDSNKVTQDLVLAALVAAIVWDLITFYAALPTSSSHALIFGMIGASVSVHGWGVIIVPGVEKTSAAIVVSPTTTFVVGYLLMLGLYWGFR